MNSIYLEMVQEHEKDLKLVGGEIKTFEDIYKTKKYSIDTRNNVKEVLKKLYEERDEYARKTKWYRTLYKKLEIRAGVTASS